MHVKLLEKYVNGCGHLINVATCDLESTPNSVPKILLEFNNRHIFLADFTHEKLTIENLKVNPKISLSFPDNEKMRSFRINGTVEIVESGSLYDRMIKKVKSGLDDFSVRRIIEGVKREKSHPTFLTWPVTKLVIYRVKIADLTEISHERDN